MLVGCMSDECSTALGRMAARAAAEPGLFVSFLRTRPDDMSHPIIDFTIIFLRRLCNNSVYPVRLVKYQNVITLLYIVISFKR